VCGRGQMTSRTALLVGFFVALALCVHAEDREKGKKKDEDRPVKNPHKDSVASWDLLDPTHVGKVALTAVNKIGTTPATQTLGLSTHPSTLQIHMDENQDGFITANEFHRWFKDAKELKDRIDKDWNKADTNKDGFMTKEEYMASPMSRYARKRMGKKAPDEEFTRMDRSKAGKVSKADFEWYVSPDDFGSADRNGDNMLSEEEFKTAPFHYHDYDAPSEKQLNGEFKSSDHNKDGKISLEEYNNEMRKAQKEDNEMDDEEDDEDGEDEGEDDDRDDDDRDDKKPGSRSKRPANSKPKKTVKPLK